MLLTPAFTARKTKDLFRGVDMELILYMAATMMIAQSMTLTGADKWLADRALTVLPAQAAANGTAVAVMLSVVAVIAHLAIASRSARAAVLIPAVALPLAGLGHDVTLMVLIAVMGTGFCQTLMASAKPVAIYGAREEAGFTQADLFRLALPLGLVKVGLLCVFATIVWPAQLGTSGGTTNSKAAAPVAEAPPALAIKALRFAPAAGPDRPSPVAILTVSLRPMPRPDDLGASAPAMAAEPKKKRGVQKAALGGQVTRDLRAAGKQFTRDLKSLF